MPVLGDGPVPTQLESTPRRGPPAVSHHAWIFRGTHLCLLAAVFSASTQSEGLSPVLAFALSRSAWERGHWCRNIRVIVGETDEVIPFKEKANVQVFVLVEHTYAIFPIGSLLCCFSICSRRCRRHVHGAKSTVPRSYCQAATHIGQNREV